MVGFDLGPCLQGQTRIPKLKSRAATILRLLGNETIQFSTRGKKSELGLRKQLNTDVKSTTKKFFFFKYMNIFIYFIKRPARDACLCMGDLQAPLAPHFVFLITL